VGTASPQRRGERRDGNGGRRDARHSCAGQSPLGATGDSPPKPPPLGLALLRRRRLMAVGGTAFTAETRGTQRRQRWTADARHSCAGQSPLGATGDSPPSPPQLAFGVAGEGGGVMAVGGNGLHRRDAGNAETATANADARHNRAGQSPLGGDWRFAPQAPHSRLALLAKAKVDGGRWERPSRRDAGTQRRQRWTATARTVVRQSRLGGDWRSAPQAPSLASGVAGEGEGGGGTATRRRRASRVGAGRRRTATATAPPLPAVGVDYWMGDAGLR